MMDDLHKHNKDLRFGEHWQPVLDCPPVSEYLDLAVPGEVAHIWQIAVKPIHDGGHEETSEYRTMPYALKPIVERHLAKFTRELLVLQKTAEAAAEGHIVAIFLLVTYADYGIMLYAPTVCTCALV